MLGTEWLTYWDFLLLPFYLLFIFILAAKHRHKMLKINPAYEYYTIGLFAKIAGAISICLVYAYHYKGGDTVTYKITASAIINLLQKDPRMFWDVVIHGNTPENYSYFDMNTGYPAFRWNDQYAIFTSILVIPVVMLGFKSFMVSAVLLAWICYSGVWKIYLLFCEEFPAIRKELAISVLFIPSVLFWGSGLLKDTITLAAVGWYLYSFYRFLIQRKYNPLHALAIFISAFILLGIKPYIMFALVPGSLIWLTNRWLSVIENRALKVIFFPVFYLFGVSIALYALTTLKDSLGEYALDTVVEKAAITQDDMKQTYYRGNTFDIGGFEPTVLGMLGKAHIAIGAALFRPTLLDVKNVFMLFAALENTYMLLLTIVLLIKLKFFDFFKMIINHPLLLFAVLFSLFFAFATGLSISNFGSLVRLRIPCLPFYVSALFILRYLYEIKSKKKLQI